MPGKAYNWSAEDLEALRELYPSGGAAAVLRVLTFPRTPAAVRRAAHKFGILHDSGRGRLKGADKKRTKLERLTRQRSFPQRARELHDLGHADWGISKLLGVTHYYVVQWRQEHGLPENPGTYEEQQVTRRVRTGLLKLMEAAGRRRLEATQLVPPPVTKRPYRRSTRPPV